MDANCKSTNEPLDSIDIKSTKGTATGSSRRAREAEAVMMDLRSYSNGLLFGADNFSPWAETCV